MDDNCSFRQAFLFIPLWRGCCPTNHSRCNNLATVADQWQAAILAATLNVMTRCASVGGGLHSQPELWRQGDEYLEGPSLKRPSPSVYIYSMCRNYRLFCRLTLSVLSLHLYLFVKPAHGLSLSTHICSSSSYGSLSNLRGENESPPAIYLVYKPTVITL